MDNYNGFPRQAISDSKKDKEWAKSCIKYFSNNTTINSSLVRKTVAHKKINYDLYRGVLNIDDLISVINPNQKKKLKINYKLQHFPIINNKIQLLIGEEIAARLDFSAVITNPTAISDIEEHKKTLMMQDWINLITDTALSEEDYQNKLQKLSDHYLYDWQDEREIAVNSVLKHYWEELNMPSIFHDGYLDVCICNEEIYQCGIVSGEPYLRRLNPMKVRIYKSGSSNKIEDADAVVIEDYWQPSRIIDEFSNCGKDNSLTEADIKTIEKYTSQYGNAQDENRDNKNQFIFGEAAKTISKNRYDNKVWLSFEDGVTSNDLPYDYDGNIRVLQVFWKTWRKIKKVKRYDETTGDTIYELMPDGYVLDEERGETSETMWIPQAWKGVMIGAGDDAIFVDMGPCKIQYNRMSDPCKCHFGIIGTIYTYNEGKPYSLVDMMKPYSYAYDVEHDRINKLSERNMGKIIQINAAMKPANFTMTEWIDYMKSWGINFVDPFNETVRGKPAGLYNVASTMDMELSNSIQAGLARLEYIKKDMGEVVGITPQREGQVQSRETFGGIERANLQSSHTTRWYSSKHQDTQKRVLECFIETAKMAWRSGNGLPAEQRKFKYITSDGANIVINIDGDQFAECDYGITLKVNYDTQAMNQQIQMVAQAEAQNDRLPFSVYLKMLENTSISDKIKTIEVAEKRMEQMAQQAQQAQAQMEQQKAQFELQKLQMELDYKDRMNQRDNETKLMIADISKQNVEDVEYTDVDDGKENMELLKLEENARQHDDKMLLERLKMVQADKHHTQDLQQKKIQSQKPNTTKK